jgi:hypothetical protein
MANQQGNSTISTSLVEHRILELIKQALRITLDWQAPEVSIPRKLSSLQFTIQSFQRHLDRVMSIEEEGGYMHDVLNVKPNLQCQVECLANDHAHFRVRMRKLLPELSSLNDWNDWDDARLEDACNCVRALLDDVDRHDAREIELLEESLWTDDGGEG